MCRLGGYLGHSGIILEPPGVIRDALTHRGASGPNRGEGVGKGVNPFNEGKESSLNHLRPEGWWDLACSCKKLPVVFARCNVHD